MGDLVRLIAVALVSFAVVGAAMVYSRGGDVSTTLGVMSDGVASTVDDIGSFLTGGTRPATEAATDMHTLSLTRPNAAVWVGLAGFPDQTEVTFPLPRGGDYLSGAFDLAFDTQLAEHGDGLLTLSVNGTPRGQLVLESGRRNHQVRIELTPTDLAGDRIVLLMAGRGTTNSGQICPTDAANSGSAVTLTAESRLELVSASAPTDMAGLLAAAPQPLVLRAGGNAGDLALTLWASQQLNRAGIQTRLGEAGRGETAVDVTTHAVSAAGIASGNVLAGQQAVADLVAATGSVLPVPGAFPVGVADLGAETIVKSFRGSRRWTIPFTAAGLPGGALPESFALRLKTTPLASGNDWVVRIVLNGHLIETRRIAGSADTVSFDVALPPERLLPANGLVVELVDTTPNQGICTRPPDAQAQLLPESALLDSAPSALAWASLIERLAVAPDIALSTSGGLTPAQTGRAGDLLSLVLPRTAKVRFDDAGAPALSVVTRAGLAQALVGLAGDAVLTAIIPTATASGTALVAATVPSAEFNTAYERLAPDDVLLLVAER